MSYTIIGDAVNAAARLMQMAQAGEVLVSGDALRVDPASSCRRARRSARRGRAARQVRGRSRVYSVKL